MAMSPCKCGKNRWEYRLDETDYRIHATCKACKRVVSFLSKKGKKLASGWVPPPLTKGVHAHDYKAIEHGPGPDATGDELWPPWIPFSDRVGVPAQ
jgi:hypothetical protein